jgi:VWFA-related protein
MQLSSVAAFSSAIGLILAMPCGVHTRQDRIRSRIDVVALDFVAVDKRGEPVLGLRSEEVLLTVEGAPRPLTSLEFVSVVAEPHASQPAGNAPTSTGSPGATTFGAGRTLIFVFAHDSIRPGNERPAVNAAIAMLKQLSPADRIAVITIPTGRVEADLTTERATVRAALQRVAGHSPEAVPRAGRAEIVALREIFRGLSSISGRKTVVLIAEGLWPPAQRFERSAGAERPSRGELADVAAAATEFMVDLVILQPANLPIDSSRRRGTSFLADEQSEIADATAGLEDLAGVTGGRLARLSGNGEKVVAQILRETSTYYVASFAVEDSDRTGATRRISVRVTRPGVTVRARSSFRVE